MVLVVAPEDLEQSLAHLNAAGETAFELGQIEAGANEPQVKII